MTEQNTNVFVSYSRADESLVSPVVNLLRANKSFVFQDIDSIQPGKKWRSGIAEALANAHMVVVFWCGHASRSDEVSKEWKAAIAQEKDLLPLLLDETPLPPELGEYQWIDFRGTVGPHHSVIDSSLDELTVVRPRATESRPTAAKPRNWLFSTGIALAFLISSLSYVWLMFPMAPEPEPLPAPPAGTHRPLPVPDEHQISDAILHEYIMLPILVAILAVAGIVLWLRRRSKFKKQLENIERRKEEIVARWPAEEERCNALNERLELEKTKIRLRLGTEAEKNAKAERRTSTGTREIQRSIAKKLETEIIRRTALRQEDQAK